MFIEVEVVCGNVLEAERIAVAAVDNGLAAYAYKFPINSRYPWEGEVKFTEYETMLVLRTVSENLPDLAVIIEELHSYGKPAIVVKEISYVHHDCYTWVMDKPADSEKER